MQEYCDKTRQQEVRLSRAQKGQKRSHCQAEKRAKAQEMDRRREQSEKANYD